MNFENRITNFEQSQKLKELGVSQDIKTLNYYYSINMFPFFVYKIKDYQDDDKDMNVVFLDKNKTGQFYVQQYDLGKIIRAFDGSQIDEMLPNLVKGHWITLLTYGDGIYRYGYSKKQNTLKIIGEGETKLEAKTNLLIQLLEKNIITLF